MINGKKAQEEMVGFAVIIVIVAVILLVLLGFMIKTPDKGVVESYEVESFIQSSLQYTSDCESYLGFLSIQDLVISCEEREKCIDERDSCDVLKTTYGDLISKSWNVGEKSPVKGYKLKVIVNEQEKLIIKDGNETVTYKGGFQDFARSDNNYQIYLSIYS